MSADFAVILTAVPSANASDEVARPGYSQPESGEFRPQDQIFHSGEIQRNQLATVSSLR